MRIRRFLLPIALLVTFLLSATSWGQAPAERVDAEIAAKIREEGMQRSKVMETLSYLTDVHGPRLTGSPLTRAAGEWTLKRLQEWGIDNAHFETWGPFGRGWTLEGFTANLVEPNFSPLIAYPKAWSPSMQKPVRAAPVFFDAATEKDLEKFRGKLHKAIVLLGSARDVKAHFEPEARRQTDESLLRLANAAPGTRGAGPPIPGFPSTQPGERPAGAVRTGPPAAPTGNSSAGAAPPSGQAAATPNAGATPSPAARPGAPSGERGGFSPEQRAQLQLQSRKLQMIYEEGAAVVVEPGRGDGGTVFVGSVSLPGRSGSPETPGNNASPNNPTPPNSSTPPEGNSSGRSRSTPWNKSPQDLIPQVVMAAEHYNRIVRMIQKGTPVQLEIDIASRFHEGDQHSFNIIAEIPGSDLREEVVMLGAHFDSWHAGTGATDNAVGCGVALEAMRILQAIQAKPRRTIRLGLWTGEEQGLLGSKAYVEQHFGRQVPSPSANSAGNLAASSRSAPSEGTTSDSSDRRENRRERETPKYELKPEHAKFSSYFNLDNGTGKIRGIFLQGNESVRPVFRTWLAPFADLGASTVSAANTFGTDHLSFDGVGLPGFQFIQDPLEYDSRTHHSSMDVFERIQEDDVKQASVIMATFAYLAATCDEKIPRKPLVGEIVSPGSP